MSDEIKALRAKLDAMTERLASAKKDVQAGKAQAAKIRDTKLQGLQDQTAALKGFRDDVVNASKEILGDLMPSSSNATDDKKKGK